MAGNSVVRTRIDERTKKEAADVLNAIRLTSSRSKALKLPRPARLTTILASVGERHGYRRRSSPAFGTSG
jgi:hypothetical protein